MSLILDALRKSEQERRQADPPALGAVAAEAIPLPPRRFGPLPVVAVVAVAAIVLGLFWVYLGGREAAPIRVVASAAKPLEPPAPPAAALRNGAPRETSTASGELPRAPELKPNPFVAAARQNGGVVRDLASEARVPRPEETERPVAVQQQQVALAPPPVSAAPPEQAIKFLRAMPIEFQRGLPELVVNIHVYASRAADRILYINNRQYRAGDKLRDDIVVEEIVEDGAVLNHRGRRFKLPRPT